MVQMDDQNRKLLLASVLSFFVIAAWYLGGAYFFPDIFVPEQQLTAAPAETVDGAATAPAAQEGAPVPDTAAVEAVSDAPRITIDTPKLAGTISLMGARLDDLSLKTYRETLDPNSTTVQLLSPVGKEHPYYALFGWAPGPGTDAADLPGAKTLWTTTPGAALTPTTPVVLSWTSPKGLTFQRTISVDADYMFTVSDEVKNTGSTESQMYGYGVIARHGLPTVTGSSSIVHQGAIRRTDGTLEETTYSNVTDLSVSETEKTPMELIEATESGWIGFTDHYWMTTLIPEQGKPWTAVTKYVPATDTYQAEMRLPVQTLAPGATMTSSNRVFAGAKEWETIRAYQNNAGVAGYVDSIDWGWFFFLTKPFFAVLHFLHGLIGNMGLAIIALTFVVKLLVLPLAFKSYVSMARMKELQPEMEALKERCGDDKQRLQKETMQLYKDMKVNPAAGCMPALIQIPIFFSLYKVINVTIELRHAPFFGWLKDLSVPDTSSLFNLFGILPWAGPATGSLTHTIFLGLLPILLGITMWLQQKLNPAPTDPVQQSVFAWMPWVFMFMMGGFASGLIVYYITNNSLSVVQQYAIMTKHGHRPDIFGNIKASAKKPAIAANSNKAPTKAATPKAKKK